VQPVHARAACILEFNLGDRSRVRYSRGGPEKTSPRNVLICTERIGFYPVSISSVWTFRKSWTVDTLTASAAEVTAPTPSTVTWRLG
jgi:hypothetical protein